MALYFFNMVVLLVLATKSLLYYRKVKSSFIAKSFVQICFTTAAVYLFSIVGLYLALNGQQQYSMYVSVATMVALYLSFLATADFIRDLTGATLQVRVLKTLLVLAGMFMISSTILVPQTATIDANGIATAPTNLTAQGFVYALSVLITYNWSSLALIRAGIQNPRIRTKLFILAGGFLLGTWSAAGLALAKTFNQVLVVYALFFLSYVIQLIAIFEPSEG